MLKIMFWDSHQLFQQKKKTYFVKFFLRTNLKSSVLVDTKLFLVH